MQMCRMHNLAMCAGGDAVVGIVDPPPVVFPDEADAITIAGACSCRPDKQALAVFLRGQMQTEAS